MIEPAEAAALAVKNGMCGEIDPTLGFVCTRGRGHPPDEHRAVIVGGPEDGHVCDVWPATPAP